MTGEALPEAPRTHRREIVGRMLFAAGALTLPLGAGVGIGYWAADRDVRWISVLAALLLVWALALAAMVAGSYLLGPALGRPKGRKRIVALGAAVALVAGARVAVYVLTAATPLTSLDAPEFHALLARDSAQYRTLDRSLASAVALFAEQKELFRDDVRRVLSADEERTLLDAWRGYVDAAFALDQIRLVYEDYYRFDLSRLERDRHLKSFLLTFAAELSLYQHTSALADLLGQNRSVVRFLSEERAAQRLRRDSVASVLDELSGMTDLSRVVAGRRYLELLDQLYGARAAADSGGFGPLWQEVHIQLSAMDRVRGRDMVRLSLTSDLEPIRRGLKHLVFPVQKSVAEWMGDTRVRRAGRYFIGAKEIEAMLPSLQPGDVLLARKNWYLSNLGLPGFWPHAILYLGTDEQLAAAFDGDGETRAWIERACGGPMRLSDCLARRHPSGWKRRQERPPGGAHALLVIEAISEGVSLSPLEEAAGDYLAALRPRLPAVARAEALDRALGFLGRPYDFDFDFSTDHALVCTELVWRSYRPIEGSAGMDLPLVQVAGRATLPAHEIVRLFKAEHGRPTARFEFVYFLEAREADGRVFVRDAAALLATVERSKWDVTQE